MSDTTPGPLSDRKIFVNIHGELLPAESASVSVMDHGFLYGDSVYETIRTYRKAPFLLGRHLDRLERSLGRIFLEMLIGRKVFAGDSMAETLVRQLIEAANKNGGKDNVTALALRYLKKNDGSAT